MKDIDIVSVYTNVEMYNEMRVSAERFSDDVALHFIGLDNTGAQYSCAAQAYNYALQSLCHSEVIVFCHQDIVFEDGALATIYELCVEEPHTLWGTAGKVKTSVISGRGRTISSMGQGIDDGHFYYNTLQTGATQNVMSLDECLIAANKAVFDVVQFDPIVCDGWHLYAVDISYQCHLHHFPVKVFDAHLTHLSNGNMTSSFFDCEAKLADKYRKYFRVLTYTCGWTYTAPIMVFMRALYNKIKAAITK